MYLSRRAAQLKREDEEAGKRHPENPIRVARRYLQERENDRLKTYEEIARKFGVSKAEVCYHIGLVNRLPAEFVAWLEGQEEPEVLRVLTERRLRPIARLANRQSQRRELADICGRYSLPSVCSLCV